MLKQSEPRFTPRRGRPSREQVEAIDRTILQTARRLFLESGNYDDVSMEAVAFVSGISKGTLYARFPAKGVLFAKVIDDVLAEWSLLPVAAASTDPRNANSVLKAHARNLAASVIHPDVRALRRVVQSTGGRFPDVEHAMAEHGFASLIMRIADDLDAIEGKSYRDTRLVASIMSSAILGWNDNRTRSTIPSLKDITAFADDLVTIMIAGEGAW